MGALQMVKRKEKEGASAAGDFATANRKGVSSVGGYVD